MSAGPGGRRTGEVALAPPSPLLLPGKMVERRLADYLAAALVRWPAVEPALAEAIEVLRDLTMSGGKRVRAALCYWAFVGAGGSSDDPRVVDAAAALELFQIALLIHDDVIDRSPTRRGLPTSHVRFAERHRAAGWLGDPEHFGNSMAIVLGDFAYFSSLDLLSSAPTAAREVFGQSALEVGMGQYLDVLCTAQITRNAATSRLIAQYKSGKYSIERPLHLGAALAGRTDLMGPLSAFGLPLGEAFQLSDDLLGVFGDPAVTGKPVGDDLRQGKPSLLLTVAHQRAQEQGQEQGQEHGQERAMGLLRRIEAGGLDDETVGRLRRLLEDLGARREVELTRDRLVADAVEAINRAAIDDEARSALIAIAGFVATRDR